MVTARSCIAWSSAAWVFGGVRLISSASSSSVKIGPLVSVKRVGLEVEQVGADDVARHQVGRELDAAERRATARSRTCARAASWRRRARPRAGCGPRTSSATSSRSIALSWPTTTRWTCSRRRRRDFTNDRQFHASSPCASDRPGRRARRRACGVIGGVDRRARARRARSCRRALRARARATRSSRSAASAGACSAWRTADDGQRAGSGAARGVVAAVVQQRGGVADQEVLARRDRRRRRARRGPNRTIAAHTTSSAQIRTCMVASTSGKRNSVRSRLGAARSRAWSRRSPPARRCAACRSALTANRAFSALAQAVVVEHVGIAQHADLGAVVARSGRADGRRRGRRRSSTARCRRSAADRGAPGAALPGAPRALGPSARWISACAPRSSASSTSSTSSQRQQAGVVDPALAALGRAVPLRQHDEHAGRRRDQRARAARATPSSVTTGSAIDQEAVLRLLGRVVAADHDRDVELLEQPDQAAVTDRRDRVAIDAGRLACRRARRRTR